MKVYKLDWEFNHLTDMEEDASHIEFEKADEFRFNINGIENINVPSNIYFRANFNIIPHKSDYPIVDLGVPVISKKILEILIELDLKDYRIIPTVMIDDTYLDEVFDDKGLPLVDVPINKDFFILQLLSYTDCFNYEISIFKPLRSNPTMPGVIKKLVLKTPPNGFPAFFRILEVSSDIFISKEAKEAFELANIKGCVFEEVEVTPYEG